MSEKLNVMLELYRDNDRMMETVERVNDSYLEMLDSLEVLEDENAKLRELCADMWRFTGTACKKYPRLFDPAAQGPQMVQLNMIDAFEQRMRELGVEVS